MKRLEVSRERDRLEGDRSPSGLGMDTALLVGTWVNFDPMTTGIARVAIRRRGETLLLRVVEAGPPAPRPWPEAAARALAAAVDGDQAVGFVAHCDPVGPSDSRRAALYGYVNRGLLTIDSHVRFPPGSREIDLMARAHYYRSVSAPD